jgi:subtilisin family serine protease
LTATLTEVGVSTPGGEADAQQTGGTDIDHAHGTFVAGLIRQQCPDANILDVEIGQGDGVVRESAMLHLFRALLVRQVMALRNKQPDRLIDVVCLAFGYYDEQPEDQVFDHRLLRPIQALARHGVVVVASAGNDATTRPFYPAAYAPHAGGVVAGASADSVPVISVGAQNPNERSVALFSNAGPWVRVHRPGAALVSTFPADANGSMQPVAELSVPGDGVRSTMDPDDYTVGSDGGFGTWSGTSFAAPVLAGEIAQALLDSGNLDKNRPKDRLERGWAAVTACTEIGRP